MVKVIAWRVKIRIYRNNLLRQNLQDAEIKLKSQEALLAAYKAHADGDAAGALEQLHSVDQERLSADARVL